MYLLEFECAKRLKVIPGFMKKIMNTHTNYSEILTCRWYLYIGLSDLLVLAILNKTFWWYYYVVILSETFIFHHLTGIL